MPSIKQVGFKVRVLIYWDEKASEWVAHALEMDLVGTGKNQAAATKELEDAIECQLTFAMQENDLSMVNCPAPKDVQRRWAQANQNRLREFVPNSDQPKIFEGTVATVLDFPREALQNMARHRFKADNPLSVA